MAKAIPWATALILLMILLGRGEAREIPVSADTDSTSHLDMALESAAAGDTLMLAPGLYRGTHTLKPGVSLIGLAGPDSTVLDGDGGRYVLYGKGIDSTTVISGLTIQNGRRDHPNSGGGGIYLHRSSPVVINNVFREHLGYLGPGVYMNYFCNAVVAFNTFYGNEGYLGGAVSAYQDCAPLIYNNVIVDNKAVSGGGILSMNSAPVILNNTIVENRASQGGGAIYCDSSPALIQANVMIRNAIQGAVFCLDDDKPATLRDNLFWDNEGGAGGGLCPAFLGEEGNCEEEPGFEDAAAGHLVRTHADDSCSPSAGARAWDPQHPPVVPESVLALWRSWSAEGTGP